MRGSRRPRPILHVSGRSREASAGLRRPEIASPSRTGPGVAIRAALLALALAASGCLAIAPVRPDVPPGRFAERTVVLSVEGTAGLAFEGRYGTPSASTQVRGAVPARYTVKTAVGVVAAFTKSAADGDLVVRTIVDGQVVQERTTSAPFGTVMVMQMFSR